MKFNVRRHYLLALAGTLWTLIGAFLSLRGVDWILEATSGSLPLLAGVGVFGGFGIYFFALSKIAQQNVLRISALPPLTPITSFLAPRGYVMIAGMILLGLLLRNSSLPRMYLSPFYIGMGLALFLGSIEFHRSFFRGIARERNANSSSSIQSESERS